MIVYQLQHAEKLSKNNAHTLVSIKVHVVCTYILITNDAESSRMIMDNKVNSGTKATKRRWLSWNMSLYSSLIATLMQSLQ